MADSADTDIFSLTEKMLLTEAEKDENFQQNLKDRLSLLDINDDGFVSVTELNEMIKGLDFLSDLTETEKKETAAAIEKAFKESDIDHDRLLNKTEMETFIKKFRVTAVKLDFKRKDVNGDGVIDLKDIPPIEDSMKKLDQAMKKLDSLLKKTNAISSEEMARNFMKNTGTAIAKEDFYRMDKDGNGCVTASEYVDYQLKQQQKMLADEKEENSPYQMSHDDFLSLYRETEKRKPDCLTMDEYIVQQSSFLDWNIGKTPE